jgi:hypothetical protein
LATTMWIVVASTSMMIPPKVRSVWELIVETLVELQNGAVIIPTACYDFWVTSVICFVFILINAIVQAKVLANCYRVLSCWWHTRPRLRHMSRRKSRYCYCKRYYSPSRATSCHVKKKCVTHSRTRIKWSTVLFLKGLVVKLLATVSWINRWKLEVRRTSQPFVSLRGTRYPVCRQRYNDTDVFSRLSGNRYRYLEYLLPDKRSCRFLSAANRVDCKVLGINNTTANNSHGVRELPPLCPSSVTTGFSQKPDQSSPFQAYHPLSAPSRVYCCGWNFVSVPASKVVTFRQVASSF